ncbi:MAG: DUF2231 domain-containing protein [Cyclobacteriaceae bacterium]
MSSEFFGRLHPILVHFPIGILILGFLLELLSYTRRFRKVRGSVPVAIFAGAVSSALSVVTGLLLSEEGGYEPDLLLRHRLFAFITLAFAVMLLVVVNYGKYLPKSRRKPARLIVFLALMGTLTITGNFGGALTHGRGYLNPAMEEDDSTSEVLSDPVNTIAPVRVYEQIIAPIFEEKCIACHGQKKQKGKLRLDTQAGILKGGAAGMVLLKEGNKPGELLNRIKLPIDHEDHMPPSEKLQLTGFEIDLITGWVMAGASFEGTVQESNVPVYQKWLEQKSIRAAVSRWPDDPGEKPSEKAILTLRKDFGVTIQPLSAAGNYLEIGVPVEITQNSTFWTAYREIATNLVSLNLAGAILDRDLLADYCTALQLRKIYLNGARIQTGALKSLQNLKHLRYLNLISTNISAEDLNDIAAIGSLEEVYVFGHSIAGADIQSFITRHPKIKVDTGNHRLLTLPTDTIVFKP